jgi:RIO kinase 2
MSSAQVAARMIKDLDVEDWAVLEAIEKSIASFESVPLTLIQKETGLHPDQVTFRLRRLNYFGFIMRNRFGIILNTAGLDALAINSFVKQNLVSGMGKSIGMGKESDVFEVINDSGKESILKFYRIGRTSFRSTRKNRAYMNPQNQHQWLEINIGAAQMEGQGLKKAEAAGVTVPEFIARDRHAVLMSEIDGPMLYRVRREDVRNPRTLLKKILQNLLIAYTMADMINGDISEFNVLYDGEKPWIIDWPQFVSSSHANADEMLERDVENVVSYFRRKFDVVLETKPAVDFVKGKRTGLRITQTT